MQLPREGTIPLSDHEDEGRSLFLFSTLMSNCNLAPCNTYQAKEQPSDHMEEELYFYFQSNYQILTLLHFTLPAQAKKQSPNHGNGGRRHEGNAEQVLLQRVCSQCQYHLKIIICSHLNRVKENDKEANKRRLEAMKQLNQR